MIWAYYDWQSSNPYFDINEGKFKDISLVNKTDSVIVLIIDCNYTEEEMNFYNQPNLSFYMDTVILGDSFISTRRTPMLRDKSVPFPASFKIQIYNQIRTQILNTLDYDLFIRNIQKDTMLRTTNPLDYNEWTLVIDSPIIYGSK